ncbi:MAG TPA: diaminopimelate dehydrogenase [Epulopiscium sp.]|nr:diaminopimelate dehydrogenase [Candidatus Epulonipiscium sp.]
MNKIKVAIIGYGNVGQYAVEAVETAPDMELVGIVEQRPGFVDNKPLELTNIKVAAQIKELGKVDVAILCVPTRITLAVAKEALELGINTVDGYDIHGELWDLKQALAQVAKENKAVSIISAGWDPGTDSIMRVLMEAMAPKGITYTNFGPGMSMGHTVAAKSKDGVKEALSMTIPTGTGIHRRMVYVELEEGANFNEVEQAIKKDSYFITSETIVTQVDDVSLLTDMGHGVEMERKGVSGNTQNQLFSYSMKINNPALTSQVLVCAARATMNQQPGAYTLIEIPVIDLIPGDNETIIRKLV